MKVIIAGGRHFKNFQLVVRAMASLAEQLQITPTEIVSGCCSGIDELGEHFAKLRNIPLKRFPADWYAHGKSAGPIRNKQMAEYADALVLIWDGKSPGSASMKRMARARRIPTLEVVLRRAWQIKKTGEIGMEEIPVSEGAYK